MRRGFSGEDAGETMDEALEFELVGFFRSADDQDVLTGFVCAE